jgi:hypothetical protein
MRRLNDDPATLLLALIESGFGDRPAAFLRAEFPTALTYLELLGALKSGSRLNIVWCAACDVDHDAVVEIDLAGTARHFCPEAGWVEDNEDDLASLYLDREWLLGWLQRAFSVLPTPRRRVLLPDRIWHIGEAVLGKTPLTILFSRGFARWAELSAALARLPPTEVGILLTTTAEMPTELVAIGGYCAIDLQEILVFGADGLFIDRARFAAFIRALARKTGKLVASGGGRPSQVTLILEVFRARRARKVPYRSKSAEARGIIAEWRTLYPDCDPPGRSTIRGHLPDLRK